MRFEIFYLYGWSKVLFQFSGNRSHRFVVGSRENVHDSCFCIRYFSWETNENGQKETKLRSRTLIVVDERDLILSAQVNETIVFIVLRTNGTTIFRNVLTKWCTKGNGNQSCVKQLTVGFPEFPFLGFVQEYIQILVELHAKRFFVTIWFYFV